MANEGASDRQKCRYLAQSELYTAHDEANDSIAK